MKGKRSAILVGPIPGDHVGTTDYGLVGLRFHEPSFRMDGSNLIGLVCSNVFGKNTVRVGDGGGIVGGLPGIARASSRNTGISALPRLILNTGNTKSRFVVLETICPCIFGSMMITLMMVVRNGLGRITERPSIG